MFLNVKKYYFVYNRARVKTTNLSMAVVISTCSLKYFDRYLELWKTIYEMIRKRLHEGNSEYENDRGGIMSVL